MISIKQIINNPINSNCFVIYDKAVGGECIIVDPGSEDNTELFSFLITEGLTPHYLILTHEHFDHCWGVNELRNVFPTVKLICSSNCSEAIQSIKKNYSVFYRQPGFELAPAELVTDELSGGLMWYGYCITFTSARGHTASGIMFTIDGFVFTGDELIKGIKTVTKLKTGSKEFLHESMSFLKELKGRGLIVYPGHGEVFELDSYNIDSELCVI